MKINFMDLFASLEIMWKGMAGLFLICGFIMLLTVIISRLTSGKLRNDN